MRRNQDSNCTVLIESKRLCSNGIEQLHPDDNRPKAIASERMLL